MNKILSTMTLLIFVSETYSQCYRGGYMCVKAISHQNGGETSRYSNLCCGTKHYEYKYGSELLADLEKHFGVKGKAAVTNKVLSETRWGKGWSNDEEKKKHINKDLLEIETPMASSLLDKYRLILKKEFESYENQDQSCVYCQNGNCVVLDDNGKILDKTLTWSFTGAKNEGFGCIAKPEKANIELDCENDYCCQKGLTYEEDKRYTVDYNYCTIGKRFGLRNLSEVKMQTDKMSIQIENLNRKLEQNQIAI